MEQIFKAIEDKLAAQDNTILLQKYENERLKKELAERDRIIAEQTDVIAKLEENCAALESHLERTC